MGKNPGLRQWLVFWLIAWSSAWLGACLPLVVVAADASRDFAYTEPEFETLHDSATIDNQPVTALMQDARGLIWIGTQDGLLRYDGYLFRKFAHKAGDPFSLAGNFVNSLAVAKDGRLWVGTFSDGISVLDPASERFEHFRHDEKVPESLSGGTIRALAGDGQGGMWIATDQGLDHLANGGVRSGLQRLSRDGKRFETVVSILELAGAWHG